MLRALRVAAVAGGLASLVSIAGALAGPSMASKMSETKLTLDACKQRAYRLRRLDPTPADLTTLAATLRRQRALRSAQIYECGVCGERRLSEPRCPDCHRFGRAIGLGGLCTHCDEPILLADLFPPEVLP